MDDMPITVVWLKEYRTRKRKNSKWEPWHSLDRPGSAFAFTTEPVCTSNDHYEQRAIKFIREEVQ